MNGCRTKHQLVNDQHNQIIHEQKETRAQGNASVLPGERARSAGFQTCRVADFQIGRASYRAARSVFAPPQVWKPAIQQTWKSALQPGKTEALRSFMSKKKRVPKFLQTLVAQQKQEPFSTTERVLSREEASPVREQTRKRWAAPLTISHGASLQKEVA